ncbi:MAG: L,D-transpeptidase, partial [Oscillospiraceae bacterium]
VSDVSSDSWYYEVASKSVALGLLKPAANCLGMTKPMTRHSALCMLAKAFQLTEADPDLTVLSVFDDGYKSFGGELRALAGLVSDGLLTGYGNSLHLSDYITRAEFITVLYRIAPNHLGLDELTGEETGGTVVRNGGAVADFDFKHGLYFGCAASDITLKRISAPKVVIRADRLEQFSIFSSKIERLVLANAGGDIVLTPYYSEIGTVAVGDGGGRLTLNGSLSNVEITGDGRIVNITGPVGRVVVGGSNNNVRIGGPAQSVKILSSGSGNRITVNGYAGEIEVTGGGTIIDGGGLAGKIIVNSTDSRIGISADILYRKKNYGLDQVRLTLTSPEILKLGETLKATAAIESPEEVKVCRASWYLDDVYIGGQEITAEKSSAVELSFDLTYNRYLPEAAALSFVLSCITDTGEYQEISVGRDLEIENYSEEHYDKMETERVLSLVTTGYKGDYTLKWAQENDYDGRDKEIWVNSMGYESNTGYLIWVSIAYQRANVFTGSKGSWVLDRSFIVGTGTKRDETPAGVWKILGKNTEGWTTPTYTVKPLLYFINSAYAFHSRLYAPGTTTIIDERIGFPVSHGCVRMYTEDVAWMYDNIPVGTAVVVY